MVPYRKLLRNAVIGATFALSACGGGGSSGSGGGGGSQTTTPAPSDLSYVTPPAFTVEQAIAPLTPTVTGTVTGYSVGPALPAGLSLNSATGVISGTPTAVTTAASYTVTATNAGGAATATVSITVNVAGPGQVSYSSPGYSYTANVSPITLTPGWTGGAPTNWQISPVLPAGLTFDNSTGAIDGTPTAASAPTSYAITATNATGKATTNLTLAVAAAPLIDLGHADSILSIQAGTSALLSLDQAGHWILQDYASGNMITEGDGACSSQTCTPFPTPVVPVGIAGDLMFDPTATGVELRSTVDGHVITTLPRTYTWYSLASDGSYVVSGGPSGLTAWAASGAQLLTKPGDYSGAKVFAAPGQIQVALGSAGQSVIETIATSTGVSTISPAFGGTFASWFVDGSHFASRQGTAVYVYSNTAVQQDLAMLSADSLMGVGNWLVTYEDGIATQNNTKVYPVGSISGPPAFTIQGAPLLSGNVLVVLPDSSEIQFVDLSVTTPTLETYNTPTRSMISAFAAISGGSWVVGDTNGVIFDGATINATKPRCLTEGAVSSIVGGTSYYSIATSSGKILSYDSTTNAPVSTFNLFQQSGYIATRLASSADGSILATSLGINVYSLPSGNLINNFPTDFIDNQVSLTLSASGTVIAGPSLGSGCSSAALDVMSGSLLWCGNNPQQSQVALSPDGTIVAASGSVTPGVATTYIYKNGTFTATVAADIVGWLSNTQFLAATFGPYASLNPYPFEGNLIYDASGNQQAITSLPLMPSFQLVNANTIYSPLPVQNAIFSLSSGAVTWTSADAARRTGYQGVVAGSQVVFASGALVLVQPIQPAPMAVPQ
jgi:Putative Ig domain